MQRPALVPGPAPGTGAGRRWTAPAVQALALATILSVASSTVSDARADLAPGGSAGGVPLPVPVVRAATPVLPVQLDIPDLKLSTRLIGLRKQQDGTLQVPQDPQRAGWYSQGPAPGQRGAAVIAGHVDSVDGPGVFARVRELEPGAAIRVRLSNGTTATYVVNKVESHPKRSFPTGAVYGSADRPLLRLVTCGGEFDRRSGHYRSNVVVFASAA